MLTENEILTLTIAAGSVVISLVATGIALAQLRASVRQSRHQATFEHLGRVRKLLRQVSGIDPEAARASVLAYYNHETNDFPQSARDYLDLLDEWDLLGVAYKHKQVDRKIVLNALRNTLRNPHTVNRKFIDQIKRSLSNPMVYEDLDLLIKCCVRPTWFEWMTSKGKGLYVRSKTSSTTTSSSAPISVEGALSGRGNAGLPPATTATPEAGTNVTAERGGSPQQERIPMSDPKPAAPPPPPAPPPPVPGERGETPGFRPPPNPPPERR